MGARNRPQQTLEVVRTDPIRGLLFIKGSVPGHKGSWVTVADAIKLPRNENAPYPAGLIDTKAKIDESELPAAGLVDEAAVHEIPALPSDEEVAAIAAEQEAGAAAETSEGTDAEAGQTTPEGDAGTSDEGKEG
jgi:large subunit ribosomal protein L3